MMGNGRRPLDFVCCGLLLGAELTKAIEDERNPAARKKE
jgi:hypothetical protein